MAKKTLFSDNRQKILMLGVVALAIFLFFGAGQGITKQEPINKPGDTLVVLLYDNDGNLINPATYSFQTFSTVGGTPGVGFISFNTIVNNSGNVTLENVRVSSASPTALSQAYSGAAPRASLLVGQTHTFSSSLINVTQFEGQTVTFRVNISTDYKSGEGATLSLLKSNNKTLTITADICAGGVPWNQCDTANKPKYCQSGILIDKASVCGCPAGYVASGDSCILNQCTDGTLVGQCTAQPSQYCNTLRQLVDNCQTCSCPNDFYGNIKNCLVNGTCQARTYAADFTVSVGYS